MSVALNPGPRVLALTGLVLGALACTPGADSDWAEAKAWVRTEFPDVALTTVDELSTRLADPELARPVLIDARAPGEFDVSHLEGAQNAESAETALALLRDTPRDAPIVVYCSVGYRSAVLARELTARGFTDVKNLEGSIFEWANRRLPVYRGADEVQEVHPFDAEWGRLLDRGLWSEE
jgi:rhodanese-related sulfurtransferase